MVLWSKTYQPLYLDRLCMEENHKGDRSEPDLEEWGIPEVTGKIFNLAKEICRRDLNTLRTHKALDWSMINLLSR